MKQISIKKKPDHLYRKGVGIVLVNEQKKIFVGKRIYNNSNAWQMPQGGIDEGENEDLAVMRELYEETGILQENIIIIAKSSDYFYYNLPYNLQKKFWGGRYIGQKQRWYLAKFCGNDNQINLTTHSPEFSNWQWVEKENLISLIVNFKRELYQQILLEFQHFL
jgi:putative (di)nucleoside polyphosphate hydrolase